MIFIPPFMLPAPPRKTKEQVAFEHKQDMAKTIMSALAQYQPKKLKRKRK